VLLALLASHHQIFYQILTVFLTMLFRMTAAREADEAQPLDPPGQGSA
jgi:hypothetical protein